MQKARPAEQGVPFAVGFCMSAAADLSRARQRLGFSLADISNRTKIKIERLRAIEEMDETELPSLVYLKGFLRTYAKEVALDPDDVSRRYLTELSSARRTDEGEALPGGGALFPLASVADDRADTAALPTLQRAAGPRTRRPPRAPVRYAAVLVVPILALLAAWMFRPESGATLNRQASAAAETHEPAVPEAETRDASVDARSDAAPAANAQPVDAPSAPSERTRVEEPTTLSGSWRLTNRVRSASVGAFEGLELGFQLKLQQEGDYVFGTGYKVTENGEPLAGDGRTPIFVEGTLNGRHLELTFTERGRRRTSGGTLELNVAEDGMLRGVFAGDAAHARGASVARRVQP